MSRVEKMKGGEDGGQRKRNAPSPYMRGNAPIIKDTYVHPPPSQTFLCALLIEES
jgi:hypothetical protein